MSVKFKVIGLSVLSIIVSVFITIITATMSFEEALMKSSEKNLVTDISNKKSYIETMFNNYESLVRSIAVSDLAKDSLKNLSNSFQKLNKEVKVENEDVLDQHLIAHYDSKYLSKVNYDVDAENRKLTIQYLPNSIDGKIAQKIFILENQHKVGEKNKLDFHPQYEDVEYMKYHKQYHRTFGKILNEFNIYDLFLIHKDGNIVYSAYKEPDFATNLRKDVYKLSGLGRAFFRAMDSKPDTAIFEDFDYYEPSYNKSKSFISAPIYVNGEVQGVIVFQVGIDKINDTMTSTHYGNSDESYIVGSDMKMRTDSRFIEQIEDKTVKALHSTIGAYTIENEFVKKALMGESGTGEHKNYLGSSTFIAYEPLDIFGGKWAIIGEISEKEGTQQIKHIINIVISVSIISTVLAIIGMFIFIDKFMNVPLEEILKTTSGISNDGDGDLTKRLSVARNDEFGLVGNNINGFIDKMQNLVNTVKDLAERNLKVSKQVSRVSDIISQRISSENKTLSLISDSGRTISTNLKDTTTKIKESKDLINQSNNILEKAKVEVGDLAHRVSGASSNQKELAKKLSLLSDNAEKIKDVLFVIDDIADQTNLLALNAAIEAARAGEHGRGFAVVAFEVTKLADKTQESLADVNKIVTIVLDEIRDAVSSMNKNATTINELSNISVDANKKITESSENIRNSVDIIETTVDVAVNATTKTTDIIDKIQQIAKLSNENTKSIEEMLSTAEDLNKSGNELQNELGLYKS
jgi:methyl-accepting chemotaxis protein